MKYLLLTKPAKNEPNDLKVDIKLVKNLFNEVFELKNNLEEGTSNHKSFRSFHKKGNNQAKPL
jgi:hypothetical protein